MLETLHENSDYQNIYLNIDEEMIHNTLEHIK